MDVGVIRLIIVFQEDFICWNPHSRLSLGVKDDCVWKEKSSEQQLFGLNFLINIRGEGLAGLGR